MIYFDDELCETTTRLADIRRLRRMGWNEDAELDDDGWPLGATRQSLKRNFMSKAFGPILDYVGDFELQQFVFDLFMWSDVEGKKEALRGKPMWQMMKGALWTPQYWKIRHAAALDMQAQCGFPAIFITIAPYEWSAPYHQWLLHHMESLGRQRLGLAGLEALHLAHILTELKREWLAGGDIKHGSASTNCQRNIFGGTDAEGQRLKVNFLSRLEFQDGKRREVTQDYHGRGSVHLHCLIFAETVGPMHLENKLSASIPEEGHPLRGHVLDGQAGRTGSETDKVHLRHSKDDKRLGIRAYSPELLDVIKSHQDVQVERGSGLLLKYAATYLPKFSDGPGKGLMDDSSTAYGAARRVLFTFHPGEAEMWLLLANQLHPSFFMGGTMFHIVAPCPGMWPKPDYVLKDEASTWRAEMCLLQFLRKCNKDGNILDHIRKAHRDSGSTI
eukprot:2853588-Amphidinium_carterae.4